MLDRYGNHTRISESGFQNHIESGASFASLEFEYTLLYQMLREQLDEKMERKYNDRDIMSYLDNIREMGLRVTFQGNE